MRGTGLRVILRSGDVVEYPDASLLLPTDNGHMLIVLRKSGAEIFPVAFFPTVLVERAEVIDAEPLTVVPALPFAGLPR